MKKATTNLTQQLVTLKEKIAALTESNNAYEQQQAEAAQAASYNNNARNWNTSSPASTGNWDYVSQGNPDDSPVTWDNSAGHNIKLPEGYLPYR